MKRLLLALGLTMSLLTSVIIQQKAQAQHVLPAYAYQIRSSVGTFTDISDKTGVVRLGTDLEAGADLKNGIFSATAETDATPTFQTVTTNSATAAASVPAFPLGFDFKIGGKPMQYFVVSALGGAYFSDTPLQVPTNSMPSTAGNTNCVFAYPYQYKSSTATSLSMIDANIAKPAPDKAPACYLISGTAGNHVLTVQHDYLLNGKDEWVFQFKFYEATGDIDFIVKQMKADNAITSKTGLKRYEIGISLVEIAATYLGNALAKDPLASMDVASPLTTLRRIAVGQSAAVSAERGWDTAYITGNMVSSGRMFIDADNFPETGRTISLRHPAPCPAQTPAYTAEYYSITNEAFSENGWSAELSYNTAKFPDEKAMFNSGTILAVLSASETPDYTLSNGTFHLKGDQIGSAEVLCNQLPKIAYGNYTGLVDHTGYKITKNIPLSVTGLNKGETRYIHLYAMSYTCDGFPAYSGLCHTIPLSIPIELPQRFNTVGLPAANAVTLDVAPADGLKVMIVKSSRADRPIPSGRLAKGDLIGNDAKVMEILSAAGTTSIPLDENEACYLFAYSVDDADADHPLYSFDALSLGVRAAYPGLPGLIDFADMPYTPADIRNPNIDKTFRDLPLGWTRETAVSESIRGYAFGLGKPGYDNSMKTGMYAQIHSSNTTSFATKTEFDIVTPPVVCDKARVRVTYNIAMLQSPSADDHETAVYMIDPNNKDEFKIEYKIEEGAWTQCAAYTGDNMPDRTPEGYYPLEGQIEVAGIQGQRLRFRYSYKGIMRSSSQASYNNIASIEIKELKLCNTPTSIREATSQTTDTEVKLSWTDMNTTSAAQSFTVFYKPEAAETYGQTTVNTPTAQLTDLHPQTTYTVYVAANCGDKGESENSLPASFTTLYAFPYAESMAQDPNIIKTINGKPVSVPGPGPFARGLKSAVGPLPSSGTAAAELNFLASPTSNDSAFHPYSTYNTVLDAKAIPAAVGVREWVKEGWLITPGIYLKDNTLPLKLKFKANSAHMEGDTWVKGSLPSAYNNVKLSVLVSSNGSFTKNDVVETFNISDQNIVDQTFAVSLSDKSGPMYVALYFNNPAADPSRNYTEGNEPPEMLLEIYDLIFGYQGHELKLDVQPAGAGTVTGAGEYAEGMPIHLTATPKQDFVFLAWKNGDNVLTTETAYTFNMPNEDLTYTAHFRSLRHLVTLNVEPNADAGTVTGGGSYLENEDQVTIKATAKTGYRFVAWMQGEDQVSTDATYTFKMPTEDVTYTAKFAPIRRLSLNTNPVGAGSVTGANSYITGAQVTVNATPYENYAFVAWMNGETEVSKDNPYTFNMPDENTTYTAKFRSLIHEVIVRVKPDREAGAVSGEDDYKEGTDVTLTATAKTGYRFKAWMNGETELSKDNPYTFTMPAEDVNYEAVFEPLYTLTLNPAPEESGSVSGDDDYVAGESVTMTATASENYEFVAWMNGEAEVSKENPYTFNMPAQNLTYTAKFRSLIHEVIVRVKPDREAGAVSGEDDYKEGTDVTLTATPKTGYRFKAWMKGETELSKDNPYTFTMPAEDVNYEAVFEPLYTLTLNKIGLGTVTGAKQYAAGESVTITATASENFAFVAWMQGETRVSTDNPYTFNMPAGNLTYTALFESTIESHAVSLSIEPGEEAGSVSGEGVYEEGAPVSISATANEDYAFVAWMNGEVQVSAENPYTFNMPAGSVNYTAKFRSLKHAVTLNVSPGRHAGRTTGGGTYKEGTEVKIEANAYEHHYFVAWKNGETTLSTDATYTFTMPATNVTYTAVFDSLYTLTLSKPTGGTVTGAKQYAAGESVTLTATADEDHAFVAWMNGETQVSTENPYTFDMPAENLTYTAKFRPLKHDVTLNITPGREAGLTKGGGTYKEGTAVTVEAEAYDGYEFVAWMKGETQLSKDNPYTFTMPAENVVYTAKFKKADEPTLYHVTLNVTPADAGTVTGGGQYAPGLSITIRATAKEGYKFVAWKNGETTLSTEANYTFTTPEEDVVYTAVFEANGTDPVDPEPETYHVTLNVTPADAGSVTGHGPYEAGKSVTIAATANDGYKFVAWKNGETTVATTASHTFTMPAEDVAYTAVFEANGTGPVDPDPETYHVTLNVTPANAGSVTGHGSYEAGKSVTITATANEGYKFVAWKNGETTVAATASHTFTMPEADVAYTAVFEANGSTDPDSTRYNVTLDMTPQNAGTVTGNGQYAAGQSVTIAATPNNGYKFVAWMSGSMTVSTEARYTFNMPAAHVTYTAVFASDVANEKPLKSAFSLAAMDGKLHIRNLNGVTVKTVDIYSLNGQKIQLFSPNSRENLILPLNVERMLLMVRLTTEQGAVVYKVYLP